MGKTSGLVNLALVIAPFVVGLLLWASFSFLNLIGVPAAVVLAACASIVGFVLLVLAKLPNFRAGHWLSFGPPAIGRRSRYLYFAGWAMVLMAVLLWLSLAILVKLH